MTPKYNLIYRVPKRDRAAIVNKTFYNDIFVVALPLGVEK